MRLFEDEKAFFDTLLDVFLHRAVEEYTRADRLNNELFRARIKVSAFKNHNAFSVDEIVDTDAFVFVCATVEFFELAREVRFDFGKDGVKRILHSSSCFGEPLVYKFLFFWSKTFNFSINELILNSSFTLIKGFHRINNTIYSRKSYIIHVLFCVLSFFRNSIVIKF